MPQRKFDGGDAAALLCHYYHLKPWELDDLEDEQRDLLLSKVGLIRFYNDLPALAYQFGKMGDEQIDSLLNPQPGEANRRRAEAWEVFALKPYGMLATQGEQTEQAAVEPLSTLSPEAAEGIVRWWESGDLYRLPEGPAVWRLQLAPIHKRLIARAEQMKQQRPD